jgi:hypothetical protein
LWQYVATFVYLAFSIEEISRAPILSRFGVGLLEVDTDSQTVKELIGLPHEGPELKRVLELHPRDPEMELQLAEQIEESLG